MLSYLLLLASASSAFAQNYGAIQPQLNTLGSLGLTNQLLDTFIEPLEVQIARNSYVVREGSSLKLNGQPWTAAGANVYWLGLDENVIPPAGQPFYAPYNASYPTFGRITEAMNILQVLGARTIRSQTLGISVGNPLSIMPTLGEVNPQAFPTIDWAVFQARQHGLRIIAPLIDNYDYYHGGKFVFLRWRGIDIISNNSAKVDPLVLQFYTNRTIIDDFKNYINILLTHVNPYTGLSYAEDPTIYAYETGNELGGPIFGDQYVPNSWTTEIAEYIKQLAPHKLVQDGTYGVNETHLSIDAVDIFSDHFYPPNITKLENDIALVATVNKTYDAGEVRPSLPLLPLSPTPYPIPALPSSNTTPPSQYDWTGQTPLIPPTATLSQFLSLIAARQNTTAPVVVSSKFWSLFGHDVGSPNYTVADGADGCNTFVNHTDGFTMHYGDAENTAVNDTQIGVVRGHLFEMMGVDVEEGYLPGYGCPGPVAEWGYL